MEVGPGPQSTVLVHYWKRSNISSSLRVLRLVRDSLLDGSVVYLKESLSVLKELVRQLFVLLMYIYTTTYLSLINDHSYIRMVEPRGCLTSANVRLEWHSHSTRLSIELHEQMISVCGDTGSWIPYLLHRRQRVYYYNTEPTWRVVGCFIVFYYDRILN